jgi:hypothetical protein
MADVPENLETAARQLWDMAQRVAVQIAEKSPRNRRGLSIGCRVPPLLNALLNLNRYFRDCPIDLSAPSFGIASVLSVGLDRQYSKPGTRSLAATWE